MLTTFTKWILVSGFLAVLFCGSGRQCAVLSFSGWTIAIAVFVYLNLVERFLWIPALLALAGLFGSLFVLSFPNPVNRAVNEAVFVMFIVSLIVLSRDRRPSTALLQHRSHAALRGWKLVAM